MNFLGKKKKGGGERERDLGLPWDSQLHLAHTPQKAGHISQIVFSYCDSWPHIPPVIRTSRDL